MTVQGLHDVFDVAYRDIAQLLAYFTFLRLIM